MSKNGDHLKTKELTKGSKIFKIENNNSYVYMTRNHPNKKLRLQTCRCLPSDKQTFPCSLILKIDIFV